MAEQKNHPSSTSMRQGLLRPAAKEEHPETIKATSSLRTTFNASTIRSQQPNTCLTKARKDAIKLESVSQSLTTTACPLRPSRKCRRMLQEASGSCPNYRPKSASQLYTGVRKVNVTGEANSAQQQQTTKGVGYIRVAKAQQMDTSRCGQSEANQRIARTS
ncbi:MAG: hypothetical protein Q9213_001409 [Squamulea squamosa]